MAKLKLLKFYADWCQPCKQQGAILQNLEGIDIQNVNIESEDSQELVDKVGVRGLPTLVLQDEEGNEISKFFGLTTLNKIQEAITTYNDTKGLE